jgi:hypothetical protein
MTKAAVQVYCQKLGFEWMPHGLFLSVQDSEEGRVELYVKIEHEYLGNDRFRQIHMLHLVVDDYEEKAQFTSRSQLERAVKSIQSLVAANETDMGALFAPIRSMQTQHIHP